jgi:hypothetical protein
VSLDDSSDEDDANDVTPRAKRKGKSIPANSEPIQDRPRSSSEHRRSEPCDSGAMSPVTTRRRARDGSRSSRTLADNLASLEGARFEGKFNGSGLDSVTVGISSLFDSDQTSTNGTHFDDDELPDDGSLFDMKSNPSDDSPYAQVRASVAATDNTSLSIDTPRMWCLSIIFAIAGSSTNLFFSLRYPSVSLTPIIALLLVHPLGLFWDRIFKRFGDPEETFLDGNLQTSTYRHQTSQPKASWNRRLRLWLAQGTWNEKEHCCVYVSSNVSFGFAFATDVCCCAWASKVWVLTLV